MGTWMHGGWDGWAWMMGWHLVWWVILAILVAGTIIALARRTPVRDDTSSDAMRILEERYARGEIDSEEFEHRREVMR